MRSEIPKLNRRALFGLLMGRIPPSSADAGQLLPGIVSNDLSKWLLTPTPKRDSPEITVAFQSDYEWLVYLHQGEVRVRRYYPDKPDSVPGVTPLTLPFRVKNAMAEKEPLRLSGSMKLYQRLVDPLSGVAVSDGYLFAVNVGEFGGVVWWFSPDGKAVKKVSNDQIIEFLPTPEGLFAIQGLAHLGMSEGALVRFDKDSTETWQAVMVADLKECPKAALHLEEGGFLVITDSYLLKVAIDGKVTVLIENAFWWGFRDFSLLVAPSGEIYIGMSHGVVRVRPRSGKYIVEWLLPNRAFQKAKPRIRYRSRY